MEKIQLATCRYEMTDGRIRMAAKEEGKGDL